MRSLRLILPALACLLLLSGCQTWQNGGTRHTAASGAYSLQVPAGWMFHPTGATGGEFMATKDGIFLQRLYVEQLDLAKPLTHSKRTLSDKLTPYELAEAYVDELRANHELLGLEVKENTPVTFGGQPGFRLVATYHVAQPANLQITEVRYGGVHGGRLCQLIYAAPTRHYYERDLGETAAAAQSFSFGK
jgi:hypothetical protein